MFLAALAGVIVQPAPMGVVFLSAITVAVLTGVLAPAQALAGYSNNILWLIVIAFMFARAFVKTGLGRRIALLIIKRIGTSSLRLGYALSLTDLILAPVTTSNTARTGAIVFPIAVSLSRLFTLIFLLLLAGCPHGDAEETARKLDAEFTASVSPRSPRADVINFLRSRRISYHDEPNLKLLTASIPKVEERTLTRSGVYLRFYFDEKGRLTSHEIKAVTTGL